MNHQQTLGQVIPYLIAIVLTLILLIPSFSIFAEAYCEGIEPSSSDLWISLPEFKQSRDLYDYLSENGWIDKDIEWGDFDYILAMVGQLSSLYDNIDASVILAQIAVESRFNASAVSSGKAHGLMQLTPIYHQKRMEQFVEADHIFTLDDFHDVRLNVVTGIDYMSELLNDYTNGDISYALMCYNQGPASAKKSYIDNSIVSNYADTILSLSSEIKTYLT